MSPVRRVLLLLCVSALLREGRTNSPFDFLRDLKNKIFSSSNSSESTEEQTIQCPGLDQDGVCTLQNVTADETVDNSDDLKSNERLDNQETINESISSDHVLTNYPNLENETAFENSNITQYYDEQDWNSTSANNTDNFGNDFEYPENSQNVTSLNSESLVSNVEENKENMEKPRSKRQINKVEINITIKAPSKTSSVSNESVSVSTGNASGINESINSIEGKETICNKSVESSNVQNEPAIEINGNETSFRTETADNETTESESVSLKELGLVSNYTISDSPKLLNLTEDVNSNETTSINNTECVDVEERLDLKNISLKTDLNETEYEYLKQVEIDENVTKVNDNDTSDFFNVTDLKHILENSTDFVRKIVQNVVPVLAEFRNETNTTEINDALPKNINTSGMANFSNVTLTENAQNSYDRSQNSINILSNTSGEDNINQTISPSYSPELITQDPAVFSSNTTVDDGIKRKKRYINFTILSEDEDFSVPSFPDTTEGTELSSYSMATENEHYLGNGTEEIKVLGPVCKKRYEQCANSTDCCEDYECVDIGTYNSTLYCDLRPQNLTLL